MPTEAEFEQTPDALAARAMLEEHLEGLSPSELRAFWEAVQRCYASVADEDSDEAQAA